MSESSYPMFLKMDNVIQNYAWGSKTSIQRLFGIKNTEALPQAEIWMGAHPNGCSEVTIEGVRTPLSDFIAANPEMILGDETHSEFGELPYLFKVLAAEKALSIQVHPSKEQAEKGFAKEEGLNVPLSAGHRNYKDANHKPELVFALTSYTAMNGFREFEEIATIFALLNIPVLEPLVRVFSDSPNSDGLRDFFAALLSLEGSDKEDAINGLISYASAHCDDELYALVLDLAEQYPDDIGIFSPLMLNVITLLPGEAMFLDACTPHAYIKGTGLEIMANSDNVLRAGLTPKHIDIDELVGSTRFEAQSFNDIILAPRAGNGTKRYDIPVTDFGFSVHQQDHVLDVNSAEILFAIDEQLTLTHDCGQTIILEKGESAFIPAYTKSYKATTSGKFARACN
ncbi:mannose-6-phosphate isomerase, class I [Photobacterium sagamiensis]|uniref:mannose-6-phosphate isomerase, class I n=1 Tax=Photobacterium sagamiensis TaxID=2910241 RepID=UPI003D11A648